MLRRAVSPSIWNATAAVAVALVAVPAHAVLTTTRSSVPAGLHFDSHLVSDRSANGDAASGNWSRDFTVQQFSASLGVLTGASFSSVASNFNLGAASSHGAGATGTVTHTALVTLAGASASATKSLTKGGAADTSTAGAYATGPTSVAAASLNSLVGHSNVNGSVRETLFSNKSGGSSQEKLVGSFGSHSTGVSVAYSYLNHANASFQGGADTNSASLSLLPTGSTPFGIFALAGSGGGANTTMLDYTMVRCAGQCSGFSLALASFGDLAAGGSAFGSVQMNSGLSAGNYHATYTFSFSDDTSVGASLSRRQECLTLDVGGSVTAVPEPESYVLGLAGLGVVFVMRRRQVQTAARS